MEPPEAPLEAFAPTGPPLAPFAVMVPSRATGPVALIRTRPPPAGPINEVLSLLPGVPSRPGAVAEPYATPPVPAEPLPPVPPWPAPPEPVVQLPVPMAEMQAFELSGAAPTLFVPEHPFAAALIEVQEFCVNPVRAVNRTLVLSAVPFVSVIAMAEVTTRSPSLEPFTVSESQVWSSPAGMVKVILESLLAAVEMVSLVARVNVVFAESVMLPEAAVAVEAASVTPLPIEMGPAELERTMAPLTLIEPPAATETPAGDATAKLVMYAPLGLQVKAFLIVTAFAAVTDGVAPVASATSQVWFVVLGSTVQLETLKSTSAKLKPQYMVTASSVVGAEP